MISSYDEPVEVVELRAELNRLRAGIQRAIDVWEPHGNPATFMAADLRALLEGEAEQ